MKRLLCKQQQIIEQFSASTIIEQLFKTKRAVGHKNSADFLLDQLANNVEQQKYQKV